MAWQVLVGRRQGKSLNEARCRGAQWLQNGQPIPSDLGQKTQAPCNKSLVHIMHSDLEYPSFAYAPWLCSKGSANFVMKWKESKREASISVTTIKGLVRDVTGEHNCRGAAVWFIL